MDTVIGMMEKLRKSVSQAAPSAGVQISISLTLDQDGAATTLSATETENPTEETKPQEKETETPTEETKTPEKETVTREEITYMIPSNMDIDFIRIIANAFVKKHKGEKAKHLVSSFTSDKTLDVTKIPVADYKNFVVEAWSLGPLDYFLPEKYTA